MTDFDLGEYWNSEMRDHAQCFERTAAEMHADFEASLEACAAAVQAGKKILFFGNGGSASDAQHLATELTVRFIDNRKPIAALSLATDTSTLTAAGNDLGFDHVFSRQIEALGQDGDVAIAISTSGKSPNIVNALEMAHDKGLVTIGLSGRDGGLMPPLCDHMMIVPSDVTARIQEMHILIGHMLCGALEKKLGLVT